MINCKNLYKNRFTYCLYLSLGYFPLSTSAGLAEIQHPPINDIVQQYTASETTVTVKKTSKIDQMRIMHIDIDYV